MVQFSEIAVEQLEAEGRAAILYEIAFGDAGNRRLMSLMGEMKLHGRVRVGVIGALNMAGTELTARCKVVVPGKGSFIHEELYVEFPSDHFKTKLLLACG